MKPLPSPGPILDIRSMGAFFRGTFFWKRGICLLGLTEQMSILTISNKNIFSKTQGTKLGVIIEPNKVLEYALPPQRQIGVKCDNMVMDVTSRMELFAE